MIKEAVTDNAIKKNRMNFLIRGIQSRNYVLVDIMSSLIILLFMYAAITKLLDFQTFRYQLGKSPFITSFANQISWVLPVIEIMVGLLIASKRTRIIGLYGALFLMAMFTFYIFMMLNYSYYIPCSCGGVLATMSWKDHLQFNILFWLLAAAAIVLDVQRVSLIKRKSN